MQIGQQTALSAKHRVMIRSTTSIIIASFLVEILTLTYGCCFPPCFRQFFTDRENGLFNSQICARSPKNVKPSTHKKLLGNSKTVYSGQSPAAKPLRVYYCEQYTPGIPQFFSPDRLSSVSSPCLHEHMLRRTVHSSAERITFAPGVR